MRISGITNWQALQLFYSQKLQYNLSTLLKNVFFHFANKNVHDMKCNFNLLKEFPEETQGFAMNPSQISQIVMAAKKMAKNARTMF